jgi:hypothetical protein
MTKPFDDVINTLKARVSELSDEVLDMKRTVNSLCKASGQPAFYTDSELKPTSIGGLPTVKPAQFYGKSPTVAAREYLDMRPDEPVTLEEILDALRKGGFDFNAQGWKNEVMHLKNLSISLGKNTGIFHRLPNGLIGLTKWYPGVKVRRSEKDTDKTDTDAETEIPEESDDAPTEDDVRDAMVDAAEA